MDGVDSQCKQPNTQSQEESKQREPTNACTRTDATTHAPNGFLGVALLATSLRTSDGAMRALPPA
jgi:hypothetical protein